MVIRFAAIALFACLAVPVAAAQAKSISCADRLTPTVTGKAEPGPFTARDLVEIRDFGDITISPDGRWAALRLRRADPRSNSYCLGLALIPLVGGGQPRLIDVGGQPILLRTDLRGVADIVNGAIVDPAPVWSPDGRSIAYLRKDQGFTQVWVATLTSRPRQITTLTEDTRGVEWSSPSTLRVKVRSMRDAQAANVEEGRKGYLYDRRFWAISEDRPGLLATPFRYLTVDATTGKPAAEPKPADEPLRPALAELFAAMPGGGIAWTEASKPSLYAGPSILYVQSGNRRLSCGEPCSSRTTGMWAVDRDDLVFLRGGSADNGGRTELYRWRPDREAEPRRILETDDALFSCRLANRALICGHETGLHPRTVARIDIDDGGITTLYDPNPELWSSIRNSVVRLHWTAPDGISSYGDLVLPPDHKPGQHHPLIIVQYVSRGFLRGGVGDEFPIPVFAANGYAVLSVTRPRPPSDDSDATDIDSAQRINVAGWSDRKRVLASLEKGIDTAIAQGVVDPTKIGITGLSDGSSTVQFALLNSTRFRAASMTTCCESGGSLATIGLAYSDSTTKWGYPPPGADDQSFWKDFSIAANAARMRTPLLIQASDREFRFALETVAALDNAKQPVEMYVYPDEYHAKFHPEHRLAAYQRNLVWFDFWLKGRSSEDLAFSGEMKRWSALRSRSDVPVTSRP